MSLYNSKIKYYSKTPLQKFMKGCVDSLNFLRKLTFVDFFNRIIDEHGIPRATVRNAT